MAACRKRILHLSCICTALADTDLCSLACLFFVYLPDRLDDRSVDIKMRTVCLFFYYYIKLPLCGLLSDIRFQSVTVICYTVAAVIEQ